MNIELTATVESTAWVYDSAWVGGSAWVGDSAWVYDSARVYGSARVGGSAQVYGSARVGLNARIKKTADYITFGPIGSRNSTLTAWRDVGGIGVDTGCFTGLLHEFEKRVAAHPDKACRDEYAAAIALIRLRAAAWEPITDDERPDKPTVAESQEEA